jgi:hypothetical protein
MNLTINQQDADIILNALYQQSDSLKSKMLKNRSKIDDLELEYLRLPKRIKTNPTTAEEASIPSRMLRRIATEEEEMFEQKLKYNNIVKLQIKIEREYGTSFNDSYSAYNPNDPRTQDDYLFQETVTLHNQMREEIFNVPIFQSFANVILETPTKDLQTPTKEHQTSDVSQREMDEDIECTGEKSGPLHHSMITEQEMEELNFGENEETPIKSQKNKNNFFYLLFYLFSIFILVIYF